MKSASKINRAGGDQDAIVHLDRAAAKSSAIRRKVTRGSAISRTLSQAAFEKDATRRVLRGDDPLGFVISANLRRRHLNESQRAYIASKIANMAHGGDRKSNDQAAIRRVDQASAAKMLNVSDRSIQRANVVTKHGSPELIAAVEQGHLDGQLDLSLSATKPNVSRVSVEFIFQIKKLHPTKWQIDSTTNYERARPMVS